MYHFFSTFFHSSFSFFFFFNDTATTEIYTLSLHDALPIFLGANAAEIEARPGDSSRNHQSGRITGYPEGIRSAGSRSHHRSEEHTSELQSQSNLVCRLLLEKKKKRRY